MDCIFDGCGRPVRVLSAGLCHAHYMQQRRGRALTPLRATPKARSSVCSFAGCDRAAAPGGLCGTHAHQLARRGSVELLAPIRDRIAPTDCEIEGCDRPHQAKGMCKRHYESARRRAAGIAPLVTRVCDVDGCGKRHLAKGLCTRHYQASRRVRVDRTPVACSVEGCDRPHHARGMCDPHYKAARRGSTPRKPRATPVKPRPKRKAPASTMPPGWLKPTPPKLPQRPGPKPEPDVLLIDTNPPTDGQVAATRRLLARHGALDLADMLGVAA